MDRTIRILLADDHKIFREGLAMMLAAIPGFAVVGEAEDGEQAVRLAEAIPFDVAVLDLSMPVMNGIEAARRLLERHSGARVIALSMHKDKRFVAGVLRAGARGYVLKDCAFEELVEAIRAAVAGRSFLSAAIGEVLLDDFRYAPAPSEAPSAARLTPREREVLAKLAEGLSTKEIAAALEVSVKTIETHRQQIMGKLDLYSVAELTKLAIREGLASL